MFYNYFTRKREFCHTQFSTVKGYYIKVEMKNTVRQNLII